MKGVPCDVLIFAEGRRAAQTGAIGRRSRGRGILARLLKRRSRSAKEEEEEEEEEEEAERRIKVPWAGKKNTVKRKRNGEKAANRRGKRPKERENVVLPHVAYSLPYWLRVLTTEKCREWPIGPTS